MRADQLLRRDAFGFGLEHDRRAVGVVGADEMHFVALHTLEPHPDVGLDVLHDVADVERAVGVGQGGGDEEFARHGSSNAGNERTGIAGAAAGDSEAANCIAQPFEYPLK